MTPQLSTAGLQVEICAGDARVSSAMRECNFKGKEFDVSWPRMLGFCRLMLLNSILEGALFNVLGVLKKVEQSRLGKWPRGPEGRLLLELRTPIVSQHKVS